MAITDLVPWKKNETRMPVRHNQEQDTFLDLRGQMNRLFDEFFEGPFGLSPFSGESNLMGDFAPRLDISETNHDYTVSAELPGLEPEDINISLERNALMISGEKRAENEEKGKRYYRVERSYGSFQRSIPLPDEVDEDKIDATFKRGVLKVQIPKTKAAQRRSKHIAVKTG
jgi:HSP20 family protein